MDASPEARKAPSGSPDGAEKLVGLEGLRFAAAFSVLVFHYCHFYYVGAEPVGYTLRDQPFFTLFEPFYRHGAWGVELFWAISGFIFAWKYGQAIGRGAVTPRRFAVLRFSRLYPLHFATLLAAAALQALYLRRHGVFFAFQYNDIKHFLLNLAFASDWGLQDGRSFNGLSWSLSVEVLVYILFYISCRLIGGRTRLILPVAMGLCALSFALLSVAPTKAGLILMAVIFFHLGVIANQINTAMAAEAPPIRRMFLATAAVLAFVPLTLCCLGLFPIEAASLIMFPTLILVFQIGVPAGRPRLTRVLTFLGNLTYGSYMLQFPVQLVLMLVIPALGFRLEDMRATHAFFLLYVGGVLALSAIVYRGFEYPAQVFLRRVLSARPLRTAGAVRAEQA